MVSEEMRSHVLRLYLSKFQPWVWADAWTVGVERGNHVCPLLVPQLPGNAQITGCSGHFYLGSKLLQLQAPQFAVGTVCKVPGDLFKAGSLHSGPAASPVSFTRETFLLNSGEVA